MPPVVADGRVHAAREGVALFACPECCIDLFAIAGAPNIDPERATKGLWEQYVADDWPTLEELFVTLEPSRGGPDRDDRIHQRSSGGD